MSFDLEKARQMAARGIPSVDPYSHSATALHLALDRIAELESALIEERAAVLTADMCDGGDGFGGLSFSGQEAANGRPTRVDDFAGSDERLKTARDQLHSEGKI